MSRHAAQGHVRDRCHRQIALHHGGIARGQYAQFGRVLHRKCGPCHPCTGFAADCGLAQRIACFLALGIGVQQRISRICRPKARGIDQILSFAGGHGPFARAQGFRPANAQQQDIRPDTHPARDLGREGQRADCAVICGRHTGIAGDQCRPVQCQQRFGAAAMGQMHEAPRNRPAARDAGGHIQHVQTVAARGLDHDRIRVYRSTHGGEYIAVGRHRQDRDTGIHAQGRPDPDGHPFQQAIAARDGPCRACNAQSHDLRVAIGDLRRHIAPKVQDRHLRPERRLRHAPFQHAGAEFAVIHGFGSQRAKRPKREQPRAQHLCLHRACGRHINPVPFGRRPARRNAEGAQIDMQRPCAVGMGAQTPFAVNKHIAGQCGHAAGVDHHARADIADKARQ